MLNLLLIMKNLNFNLIDDVSIGKLMKNKNKIKLNRYDILLNYHFNISKIVKHYHVRLKQNNRKNDIDNIKKLFDKFYQ